MNYPRLGLAALGGLVASFAFGFLVIWLVPALIEEGHKYPGVFRPEEEMMAVMPAATRLHLRAQHSGPGSCDSRVWPTP